jgi:Leucine-rich repeat (LRR) protein
MLLWLSVISTIFLTTTSFTSVPPCSDIKNGLLSLKGNEAAELEKYCECSFEDLRLKNAAFIDLPPCMVKEELISLKIEHTPLAVFPKGVLLLKSLEELSLKHTGLSFLPGEISQLKSLKKLDLRGTNISFLPEGLEHLEKIDLRLTDINKADQEAIRSRYPQVKIFFSSPCNCK